MPDVSKHAWTHRPRSQGGTDPVPFVGDRVWASASGSNKTYTPSGGKYRPTFDHAYCHPDATSDFAVSTPSVGRSSWLEILNPGYYRCSFYVIQNSAATWSTAGETFLQPLFESGGLEASFQDNLGVADYLGDWYSPRLDVVNGQPGYAGTLATDLTFNYDPANPVSDIDFEAPLKLALLVATFPSDATNLALGCGLFVERISETPGYATLL